MISLRRHGGLRKRSRSNLSVLPEKWSKSSSTEEVNKDVDALESPKLMPKPLKEEEDGLGKVDDLVDTGEVSSITEDPPTKQAPILSVENATAIQPEGEWLAAEHAPPLLPPKPDTSAPRGSDGDAM